ncbi:MAG: anti-sigma factor antagonist [SAR324 cluster bacterium]|nr:anti-sigma factor antagonist [SAR324 cluster bacterium]
MDLKHRTEDNIYVISLNGELRADTREKLQKTIEPFFDDCDIQGILINLGKVPFMDSSGIGFLLSVHVELKNRQKMLACCELDDFISQQFHMFNLDQMIGVYLTEEKALLDLKEALNGKNQREKTKLSYRAVNRIGILDIEGKMVEQEMGEIESHLSSFVKNRGLEGVVINFGKIKMIDSYAIGVLLSFHLNLKKHQIRLALCQMDDAMQALFKKMELDQEVPWYPTAEKALASFEQ